MKPFLERAYESDKEQFDDLLLEGAQYYDSFLNKLLADTPPADYPLLAVCFEHAAMLIREVYQAGAVTELLKLKLGTQAIQYPLFHDESIE